jgi:hypothetical protein
MLQGHLFINARNRYVKTDRMILIKPTGLGSVTLLTWILRPEPSAVPHPRMAFPEHFDKDRLIGGGAHAFVQKDAFVADFAWIYVLPAQQLAPVLVSLLVSSRSLIST